MIIISRIRGKIIKSVQCCTVFHNCTQFVCTNEQALTDVLGPDGLDLIYGVWCVLLDFFLFRANLFACMSSTLF